MRIIPVILVLLLSGCATLSSPDSERQYLRIVSEPTYKGVEMMNATTVNAKSGMDVSYNNLNGYTKELLVANQRQLGVSDQELQQHLNWLESEKQNHNAASGSLNQVPRLGNAVLYGLGVPKENRPRSLQQDLFLFGAGVAGGAAAAAAF